MLSVMAPVQVNPPLSPYISTFLVWGAIATAVVAFKTLWSKLISPLIRTIAAIEDLGPTVKSMAEEFKNNGGSSLKDKLDKLAETANQSSAEAQAIHERLMQLEEYTHNRFHDFANALTVIQGAAMDPIRQFVSHQAVSQAAKPSKSLKPTPKKTAGKKVIAKRKTKKKAVR